MRRPTGSGVPERRGLADGTRTFRLTEGAPRETSYGGDLYLEIFGESDTSMDAVTGTGQNDADATPAAAASAERS